MLAVTKFILLHLVIGKLKSANMLRSLPSLLRFWNSRRNFPKSKAWLNLLPKIQLLLQVRNSNLTTGGSTKLIIKPNSTWLKKMARSNIGVNSTSFLLLKRKECKYFIKRMSMMLGRLAKINETNIEEIKPKKPQKYQPLLQRLLLLCQRMHQNCPL
jgi:hypothetical protein